MSSTRLRPSRHRRCSTPPTGSNAVANASSLLSLATEIFTPDQRQKSRRSKSANRDPSAPLRYTYSFRRSEHIDPWSMPPSYDSVSTSEPNTLSYSLSYSRRRSRSSSFIVTPLRPTQPWTSPPNTANRPRSNSTPVSPIVSPFSASEAPVTYTPYHPGYTVSSSQHPSEQYPALDLPSPFSSPLFYWSGQSRQELTTRERIHKAQMDDLSLMSPYGSPSFYWWFVLATDHNQSKSNCL